MKTSILILSFSLISLIKSENLTTLNISTTSSDSSATSELSTTTELPTTTEDPTTTTTESTTTTTSTTTPLPYPTHRVYVPAQEVPNVPSRATRSSTTSTTTTQEPRPALSLFRGDMTTAIPEECFSFRYSRISSDCCKMPKFEFSKTVIDKCHKECDKSNSSHCCMTVCKYREMEIYSTAKGFDKKGIIKGFDLKSEKEWEKIVGASVDYCIKDQDSKDTSPLPSTTTTDRIQSLIDQAIANGQGMTVAGYQTSTLAPPTTISEPSTEALKVRQEKTKYCDVPLYVYLIVTCTRIQNFVNCPHFNSTSEECEESLSVIKKCGSNLKLRYV